MHAIMETIYSWSLVINCCLLGVNLIGAFIALMLIRTLKQREELLESLRKHYLKQLYPAQSSSDFTQGSYVRNYQNSIELDDEDKYP